LVTSKNNQKRFLFLDNKLMNSLTRVTYFGIPAIIGLGLALVSNRIIRNEKELLNRELELKLQLDRRHIKTLKKN